MVPLLESHLGGLCTESPRDNRVTEVDKTIEERHLSLMALLTQSPDTQNAFDPVLMVLAC